MKITEWVIQQAAAHTRRQLDDLRFDLAQANGNLAAARDEIDTLRKRVKEMAPEKQFQVYEFDGTLRWPLTILSVLSSAGKNTITVQKRAPEAA